MTPPGPSAAGPFPGRRPTSHERRTGRPWDASYQDGPAPWDIGRPQPAFVRLAAEGAFAGAVLDAGCGTGENALHVAARGLPVLGVDIAETAIAMAREKAAARGASLHVLCFSDGGPGPYGPHPVGEEAVRAAFAGGGWSVASVTPDRIDTRFGPEGLPAWLARI